MSEQRKSIWPWIVALLIGLPLLYVASFGPACWASLRTESSGRLVGTIYHPIFWIALEKNIARGSVLWYMGAGAPKGFIPLIESSNGSFALRRNPL
jgi:hypothetical protein